jgi:murein DD-endopeptidase MepM/ murein hydrolase activator NlpD
MSFIEPPSHLDDTNPIQPIRDSSLPGWRRAAGLISLLLAVAFTVGTVLVMLLPTEDGPPQLEPTSIPDQAVEQPTSTLPPTDAPLVDPNQSGGGGAVGIVQIDQLPTLSPDQIITILNAPDAPDVAGDSIAVVRNIYDPFTLIPDRPRRNVIGYTIVEGDTIYSIAERYGLVPETIAWSNDRSIIGNLRPGTTINILPVNGVYHTTIGSRTIAEIAASYQVTDPYVVIDSEYNNLFGASPDTVLPSGTQIVIPGGQAEQISWNPTVEREGGDVNQSGGSFVVFAPGEAGSCGRVANVGGSFWSSPIDSYSFVRGFSSWHTGVDLSASPGTPVKAANGGVVIFAGWNSWGYGNAIVLSHGPFSTLYGHLSSINVGCGQAVSAGQIIGGVGSSGNSSGPHLHFEIRYLDQPQNPTATIPF